MDVIGEPDIPPPRVVVVVVTYNSASVLGPCLASLSAGCRGVQLVEVLVADNNSADDSVAIAEQHSDALPLRVVRTGRNGGYAAALNAAVETLALAEIDGVLLLNPDIRVRPGAVAVLAEALAAGRRAVSVPKLVHPDGTLQHSLRREPTVARALAEAAIGGSRAERLGTLAERIADPAHYGRPGPAVWATGAAMMLASAAITELGPWDESFLLYSEEVDYALRARDRGWELWYEPGAVMEHIGGDGTADPGLYALLTVNRVRLFRRRSGRLRGASYLTAVTLGEAMRAASGRATARAAVSALLRPSRRMHRLPG